MKGQEILGKVRKIFIGAQLQSREAEASRTVGWVKKTETKLEEDVADKSHSGNRTRPGSPCSIGIVIDDIRTFCLC